ncbi:MAG TPA: SPOR domain-containing protein [Allosphingosinicella sp.]|nr:SPOR domain-containing protein [Allosphingosinicella sp.]
MAGSRLAGEEDSRPWLEPVEPEEEPSGPSLGRPIVLAILAILILGAVVAGYSWWSGQGATEGDGELIPAPPGPYKVKPDDPGGMEIAGEGDTAFAASAGADPKGRIDMSAVPEAPMVAAPKAAPGKAAPGTAAAEKAAPAQAGDSSIQLGAFSSQAAAEAAWKALSGRFKYLEPLTHSIVPVQMGDRTLYRLRAGGPDAAGICGRLQVAGEDCVTLN